MLLLTGDQEEVRFAGEDLRPFVQGASCEDFVQLGDELRAIDGAGAGIGPGTGDQSSHSKWPTARHSGVSASAGRPRDRADPGTRAPSPAV